MFLPLTHRRHCGASAFALQLIALHAEASFLELQLLAVFLGKGPVDPRNLLVNLSLGLRLLRGGGILDSDHLTLHHFQPLALQA